MTGFSLYMKMHSEKKPKRSLNARRPDFTARVVVELFTMELRERAKSIV